MAVLGAWVQAQPTRLVRGPDFGIGAVLEALPEDQCLAEGGFVVSRILSPVSSPSSEDGGAPVSVQRLGGDEGVRTALWVRLGRSSGS